MDELLDDFNDVVEKTAEGKHTPYKSAKRIDYNAIRTRYMAGEQRLLEDGTTVNRDISLREAASMFDASYTLVLKRSAKEGWREMKDAFKSKMNEAAEGRAFTLYLDESVVADVNALAAVSKLTKIYNAYLEAKFGDLLDQIEDLEDLSPEDVINNIQIRDMKELISIAKEIHALANSVTQNRNAKTLNIAPDVHKLTNTKGKYNVESNDIEALKAKLKLIEDN